MSEQIQQKYPVFILCGEDPHRRRLMEEIDPERKYKSKALLPFLGKRLIDWQVEELTQSPWVDELYILGLSEADLPFNFPVHYVPVETASDVSRKLLAGLAYLKKEGKDDGLVVVSSCDAPGIKVNEINQFFEILNENPTSDFVLSLVPEVVAEAVFPKSGRVVARFEDCQVLPGELFAVTPRAIRKKKHLIADIGNRRRKINRQADTISLGPMLKLVARQPKTWLTIIKYLRGKATLADAERSLSAAFGIKVKGAIIPEAGFGMDMDLPEDYERLKEYVQKTKLGGDSRAIAEV